MALALHHTGKSNRSLLIVVTKAALSKRFKCFPMKGLKQITCIDRMFALSRKRLTPLGSETDFLARWSGKSRIISLISPCVFGLAVSHRSHDYVGRVQQRRHSLHTPPSMDCRHLSSPENSWPFNVVLYRTTTLDTHPQNVC